MTLWHSLAAPPDRRPSCGVARLRRRPGWSISQLLLTVFARSVPVTDGSDLQKKPPHNGSATSASFATSITEFIPQALPPRFRNRVFTEIVASTAFNAGDPRVEERCFLKRIGTRILFPLHREGRMDRTNQSRRSCPPDNSGESSRRVGPPYADHLRASVAHRSNRELGAIGTQRLQQSTLGTVRDLKS